MKTRAKSLPALLLGAALLPGFALPALADCDAVAADADKIAAAATKLEKQADSYNPETDQETLCGGAKRLQASIKKFVTTHKATAASCGVDPADMQGLSDAIGDSIIVEICR